MASFLCSNQITETCHHPESHMASKELLQKILKSILRGNGVEAYKNKKISLKILNRINGALFQRHLYELRH